ncbi:sigma-54-dependent Fis family transcriptional regulator [Desulfatibacillum aliphaticivorans]|uniref:Transcriptional regulator, NifA, Fis Family n=1 Tax=Desulfatibacillum aliphaticivorans TaxID=218208 RepID=B8FEY5_DESAL|nr:sigma-54-dependent Fis family transcriptional regulator [Desulfatibacillum aliphaticivorans]ACL03662.1 transcriptional regulator, NifA, Fis Family [Desulfatibacillum aliphaticivorans]
MNQELSCLHDIAIALSESDLRPSLYKALELLSTSMKMDRGAITIMNPVQHEIRIEAAHGMSAGAIQKGRYKPGEGITGRVIQSGKPTIVPKTSQEPLFLDKTGHRKADDVEYSFICVPITKGKQVVGCLWVDRPYDPEYNLDNALQVLTIIAAMVAQRVASLETLQWEKEAHKEESRRLRQELGQRYSITNLVGNSNKMREVFQMISQVCKSNATVLIRGESGTGKELAATAIHYNSSRADKPFVKVNCAALPSNLIESELFGHEKGAFTGAIRQKPGKFELASKGTIFLDEIGSINLDVQANLLRVLQEKEFERVGGIKTLKADVRVIAATNRNLERAVEDGSFREDLYYRLNVFPIYMPPLRQRKTDILLLAEYFVEKYSKENSKEIRRLSSPAIDMLMQYHWPGNVRELENCIERAVVLCDSGVIHAFHLPPSLQTAEESDTWPGRGLDEAVEALEREMIVDALKSTRGNTGKAAEILKSTPRKIGYKAHKYQINYKDFR